RWLAQNWALSSDFDELGLMPQLRCEGNWEHSAVKPRRMILEWLAGLPTDTWFKIQDLIDDIHQHQPDFLRSGAGYNTWIISSAGPDVRLLHGFEHWQAVEGQYIRFFIEELLRDLGMAQIGQLSDQPEKQVFQLTPWFSKLLRLDEKLELPEENQPAL